MAFLIVPNEVSANSATVWIAAVNENPGPVTLESDGGQIQLNDVWEQDPTGTVRFQRVKIENLTPFKLYWLAVRFNNQVVAHGDLTTLPEQLPSLTDPTPFTVLLGSCFYWKEDKGALGAAFDRMRGNSQAHVKFLCGDQVYLDAPYYNFDKTRYNADQLKALFLNTYLQTWGNFGDRTTMYSVLRTGGNFFSPDDHEFWNNAPNYALAVNNSWDTGLRNEWLTLSRQFYHTFQGTPKPFDVKPVSFFTADTRTNRDAHNQQFMDPNDLDVLVKWIADLGGPGVLVVGQPVFTKKSNFLAKWGDYGLPDFPAQYSRLTGALAAAKHSVVILTGDVHYGRIATCSLFNGVELIEIISSPMSLVEAPRVFNLLSGGWDAAPNNFDIPGSPPISTNKTFNFARNHFLTLEFRSTGVGALLTVRDWPFKPDGSPTSQPGRVISNHILQ